MKYIRYMFIIIPLFILAYLIFLSISSRFKEPPQMVAGKLAACSGFSNCICTESYSNKNFEPITIDSAKAKIEWNLLKTAIVKGGGEIQSENDVYLWATFVTPLFRFVDDFEARLDISNSCIHLRSASRVGKYDFGTNLKRINHVLEIFCEQRKLIGS